MSRFLIPAYGLISYVLFLATFAYMAGFLLDIGVPKAINDGLRALEDSAPLFAGKTQSLTTSAFWINLGLVALFGLSHSIMARGWFKRRLTQVIPEAAERSTFVLQSSACLAFAMWQWRPMEAVIWSFSGLEALPFYALFFFGALVVLISTFLIDHFELFGLRQIWHAHHATPMPSPSFKAPFLYRIVRHPMQLGVIILVFATPLMTLGHLIFAGAMTAYIFVGLYFEERALTRDFGDVYKAYKRQVPMLFPHKMPIARGATEISAL